MFREVLVLVGVEARDPDPLLADEYRGVVADELDAGLESDVLDWLGYIP